MGVRYKQLLWIRNLSVSPHVHLFATMDTHKLPLYITHPQQDVGMDGHPQDRLKRFGHAYFFPTVR